MKKILVLLIMFFNLAIVSAAIPLDAESCFDRIWDDEGNPKLKLRGDVNSDIRIDISDAVYLLRYLFAAGPKPECLDQTDVNDDEKVDITDAIYLLSYLFQEGSSPEEIDKPPFMAFPIERIDFSGKPIVTEWIFGDFQGDVVSCDAFAIPVSSDGTQEEPIHLLSFESEKNEKGEPIPILFVEESREVLSPSVFLPGEYRIEAKCKDVKGYEGKTEKVLTISNGFQQLAHSSKQPPIEYPDEYPSNKKAICRVKCVTIFHNSGKAKCKDQEISLAPDNNPDTIDVDRYLEYPRGGYYSSDLDIEKTYWKTGVIGVGPNYGSVSVVEEVNGREQIVEKNYIKTGFIVVALYEAVDEQGNPVEINSQAPPLGLWCKEYQFAKATRHVEMDKIKYEFYAPPIEPLNQDSLLTEWTLAYLWNTNNKFRGALKPMPDIISLRKEHKFEAVFRNVIVEIKSASPNPLCAVSAESAPQAGSHYCIDDYFQISEGNDDFKQDREGAAILNKVPIALYKDFIVNPPMMVYLDMPGKESGIGRTASQDWNIKFMTIVEDQEVGGEVRHKVACFYDTGFSYTAGQQPIYMDTSLRCSCSELTKEGSKWNVKNSWNCG